MLSYKHFPGFLPAFLHASAVDAAPLYFTSIVAEIPWFSFALPSMWCQLGPHKFPALKVKSPVYLQEMLKVENFTL